MDRRPYDEQEKHAAEKLARQLSGHALAIRQMAALITSREISIQGFLQMYESRQGQIHRKHNKTREGDYELFLDTVWLLSFQRAEESSTAFVMLGILAFLMPDAIPQELFDRGRRFGDYLHLSFCSDVWS